MRISHRVAPPMATAWLLGLVLQGCGASAKDPNAPEADSAVSEKLTAEEMEAQFGRESDPIQKQPVGVTGSWAAYLEARAVPKTERHDGMLMVAADLGWDGDLECFVYDDVIDAGGAASTLIRHASEKVQFRQLSAYHLDRAGLDPVVFIRGIYQVEQGGVLAAGDYKLMVMPRSRFPIVCVHDAPGFAQSFARVTADFARSFEIAESEPRPMRGELWWSALDGMPVGFALKKTYSLEGGAVRQVQISASFLPTAPGELAFRDDVSVVSSDKQGQVTDGKFLAFENGEASHAIDIERSKKKYDYVGTMQGKEVRGSFQPKAPLRGEYAFEKQLKTLAGKAKKSTFDQWEYTPSIDPAAAAKVTYEVNPEGEVMVVVARMGDRAVTMRADRRGIVRQVVVPIGGKTIETVLVEEVGEL